MAERLKDIIAFVLFSLLFTLVFTAVARAESVALKTDVPANSNFWNSFELKETTVKISTAGKTIEPYSFYGVYEIDPVMLYKPQQILTALKLQYAREYQYDRADGSKGDLENPVLTLGRSFGKKEAPLSAFLDQVSVGWVSSLGANKESRRRTFQWLTGPNITFVKNIGPLSSSLGLGYRRRFFEYETRANGVVNSPDAFVSKLGLELNATEHWSLSATLIYDYSIGFQGIAHPAQIADISTQYSFTQKFSVSTGLATLRGTWDPDLKSESIRLVGDEATEFYLDLIWKI